MVARRVRALKTPLDEAAPSARTGGSLLRPPRALARRIEQAALPWPADAIWSGALVAAAATATAGGVIAGLAGALAGVALTAGTGGFVLAQRHGRDATVVDDALPELLEAVARGLRSGASLPGALGDAARGAPTPVRGSVDDLLAGVAGGLSVQEAIDRWSSRTPGDGVRLAGAALALCAELGGGASRAIDNVAATLRDRNAVQRETLALATQARASALVIAVAPAGFAVIAAAADPTTLTFLTGTPAGVACLCGGLALDAVGAWWMHRITGAGP